MTNKTNFDFKDMSTAEKLNLYQPLVFRHSKMPIKNSDIDEFNQAGMEIKTDEKGLYYIEPNHTLENSLFFLGGVIFATLIIKGRKLLPSKN